MEQKLAFRNLSGFDSSLNRSVAPSVQDFDKIHALTRREFNHEDLFLFRVALCDNEIDRDFERFDTLALQNLAPLFVGVTGICDHDPHASNQQARIYDAYVVSPPNTFTSDGLPYCYIEAKAYMVRTQSNHDLILEIDAGIKKEVSVGCRLEQAVCSICGAERNQDSCNHSPGSLYDGQLCFFTLQNPVDAYEWSFVAVPAQKNAGVLKFFDYQNVFHDKLMYGKGVQLSHDQLVGLSGYLQQLQNDAASARRDASRKLLASLTSESPLRDVIAKSLDKLGLDELNAWSKALACQKSKTVDDLAAPQILPKFSDAPLQDSAFLI